MKAAYLQFFDHVVLLLYMSCVFCKVRVEKHRAGLALWWTDVCPLYGKRKRIPNFWSDLNVNFRNYNDNLNALSWEGCSKLLRCLTTVNGD